MTRTSEKSEIKGGHRLGGLYTIIHSVGELLFIKCAFCKVQYWRQDGCCPSEPSHVSVKSMQWMLSTIRSLIRKYLFKSDRTFKSAMYSVLLVGESVVCGLCLCTGLRLLGQGALINRLGHAGGREWWPVPRCVSGVVCNPWVIVATTWKMFAAQTREPSRLGCIRSLLKKWRPVPEEIVY